MGKSSAARSLGARGLLPRLAVVLFATALGACHPAERRSAATDAGVAVSPGPAPLLAARFSRPIAAAAVASGATFVAGLVVARGAIAVTLLAPDGATRWTRDVIPGVAWSPNASLSVFRSRDGAVVAWRGLRGADEVTLAVVVGADGKVQGDPFPIGAAACATDVDLAWVDHGPKGSWMVKARAVGGPSGPPALAATLGEDREPVVYCGPRRVYALGDGDDDVTLTSWSAGLRSPTMRVIEDSDFRGDEERAHEPYSVSDVLGLVRIGSAGSVSVREIAADHRSSWRRFGRKLGEGDDVALVDADARMALLAFTRDASAPGDLAGSSSVEALAWERAGGREASYQVAAPDPTRVRGPFWSGAVEGGVVIAWVERGSHAPGGDAPILGMSYRVVSMDSPGELRHLERPADDLVDAGCDEVRCYAVALVRSAGEDGGQPEVTEVLRYP